MSEFRYVVSANGLIGELIYNFPFVIRFSILNFVSIICFFSIFYFTFYIISKLFIDFPF